MVSDGMVSDSDESPPLLKMSIQQRMDKFLTVDCVQVLDEYAELKRHKVKIYSDKAIAGATGMLRQYWEFWNKEALVLFQETKKPSEIAARISYRWNNSKRFECLAAAGEHLCEKYPSLDVNWDSSYKIASEECIKKIEDIESKITFNQGELERRILKRSITLFDKDTLKGLIESLKADKKQLKEDYKYWVEIGMTL